MRPRKTAGEWIGDAAVVFSLACLAFVAVAAVLFVIWLVR